MARVRPMSVRRPRLRPMSACCPPTMAASQPSPPRSTCAPIPLSHGRRPSDGRIHFRPASIHPSRPKGHRKIISHAPPHTGPPPPLPAIRSRAYYRRLRTPRPPVPRARDAQLQHISPPAAHQSTTPMPARRPPTADEHMDLAMTFSDADETRPSDQRHDQPIGLATELHT